MFKYTAISFAALASLALATPAFSQSADRPATTASGTTSSMTAKSGTAMGRSSADGTGVAVSPQKQKMIGQPSSASEQLLNPKH